MFRMLPRIAAAAAFVALPLSACGGGSSASGGGCGAGNSANPNVTAHAEDSYKYDKSEYTAKAGEVTFELINDGSLQHTLLVRGQGCKLTVGSRGDKKTGSVTLTAGSYEIYCDVAGHESAGMKATLTIS